MACHKYILNVNQFVRNLVTKSVNLHTSYSFHILLALAKVSQDLSQSQHGIISRSGQLGWVESAVASLISACDSSVTWRLTVGTTESLIIRSPAEVLELPSERFWCLMACFFGRGSSYSDVSGVSRMACLSFFIRKAYFLDVGFKYSCSTTKDCTTAENMAYYRG